MTTTYAEEDRMRDVIASIEAEYRRYRGMAERTLDQLTDTQIGQKPTPESNSIATLVWHVSGNLESRFTDFLTSDGEKPWRQREEEFADRPVGRAEAREKWGRGFDVLTDTLSALSDADLARTVTIRGVPHSVSEALHRSLAHTAGHSAQIAYIGKMLRGSDWDYLSIAPGGTAAYNENPDLEKA